MKKGNENANATILVVDDDPVFVKKLKSCLEEAGYEVTTAMTADKARRILEQKPIDLAILDIHLNNNPHDLSGLELAVDTDRSIPKLIITAEPTWETTRRALKIPRGGSSPAVDFLAKSEKDIYHKIVQAVRIAVPVRVFIVHGHDDGAKLAVSQFVRDLGLLPIILHDHPWGGRTIIENFENRSRVGFAIALLTPDADLGAQRLSASLESSPLD